MMGPAAEISPAAQQLRLLLRWRP